MSSKQFSKLSKSSKSIEYGTPKELFDKLNSIFKFEYDPCASPDNTLGLKVYSTKETDGLSTPWEFNTFINPPFGRGVTDWIKKMDSDSKKYWLHQYVMLLPSRTETSYTNFIWYSSENTIIHFIKGRLKFVNPVLNSKSQPHIIGSMLWIRNASSDQIKRLNEVIPGITVKRGNIP